MINKEIYERRSKMNYQVSNEITNYVKIDMEDGNSMVIELSNEQTPLSIANFQKLVQAKFYDGIIFHRVISGFMIQGGDPTGTGMGGSDNKIKGEFPSNGVDNKLSHTRGVISMARSSDPNSASSQFFIVHQDSPFLDKDYAAFGKLIDGFETLDKIANVQVDSSDRPLTEQKIKTMYFVNINN